MIIVITSFTKRFVFIFFFREHKNKSYGKYLGSYGSYLPVAGTERDGAYKKTTANTYVFHIPYIPVNKAPVIIIKRKKIKKGNKFYKY